MQPCIRRALRWVLVIPLTLAVQSPATALQWTSIGPDGGVITSVAVGPGPNPVVYAGTPVGLYRSADGGAHWALVLRGSQVSSIVADLRSSAVYATSGGSLFKSNDAGLHWTRVSLDFSAAQIAIDQSGSPVLYATSGRGRSIHRSDDGASTWSAVYTAEPSSSVSEINAVAVSGGQVYAGFVIRRCIVSDFCVPTGGGVLRSQDGIAGWHVKNLEPINALAVDPTDADTVYAAAGRTFPSGPGGLLRSRDAGTTWSTIARGEVVSVAVDPREPGTVYWGTYDVGVFRWTGGETPGPPVFRANLRVPVAVDPDSGRVWAGSNDGVFTSAAGSSGWESRNRGIRGAADLSAIAADPTSPTVYAGSYGAVWKSSDGGVTWSRHETGLASRSIRALRIDPTRPDTLYAATDSGVFRSIDGGETWSGSTGLSAYVADVAVDPRSPSRVYAIAPDAGVFRSSDGGRSWGPSNAGLTVTQGYSVDVDAVTSTVWVGTYGGVFHSTDGGSTWTPMNNGLPTDVYSVRVAPSEGSTLYASTGQSLFGSNDGGASWHSLNHYGASIAIDPDDSRTVYTASFGEAVLSTDGGASWTTPSGLPGVPVIGLAVGPGTDGAPSRVYAVAYGGGAYVLSGSAPCTADAATLCLQGDRFQVTVDWRTADGRSGEGQAVALTRESGYFWFRTATDVELAVKVVDGRSVNGRFWLFAGSLTGVEFTIRVVDTQSGFVQTYTNPLGQVSSFVDTEAFPGALSVSPAEALTEEINVSPAPVSPAGACTGPPAALCVSGGRFQVSVQWETRDGRSGAGQAVPLTADAGYFWFFGAGNLELVVKVLDGRPVNGHFWVFSGALSNVAYTITVTDTETGVIRTFENPQGRLASFADTEAF